MHSRLAAGQVHAGKRASEAGKSRPKVTIANIDVRRSAAPFGVTKGALQIAPIGQLDADLVVGDHAYHRGYVHNTVFYRCGILLNAQPLAWATHARGGSHLHPTAGRITTEPPARN